MNFKKCVFVTMVTIISLTAVGCSSSRQSEPVAPKPALITVPVVTPIQEALIGSWSWDNQRQIGGLEHWIPANNRDGHQAQDVTFSADGNFTLRATHAGMDPFVWHGRWTLEPERRFVGVKMDDLPEPPNTPKVGIKGTLMLNFSMDNELKEWHLVRPMADGYLLFFKRAE